MYFAEMILELNDMLLSSGTTGLWKDSLKIRNLKRAIDDVRNFSFIDPDSRRGNMIVADWDWLTAVDTSLTTVADDETYDMSSIDKKSGGIRGVYLVDVSDSTVEAEVVILTKDAYFRRDSDWMYICTIVDDVLYLRVDAGDGDGHQPIDESGHTIRILYEAKDSVPSVTGKGSITAFADGGTGYTEVASAAHGLSNGDYVTIVGTDNYDGAWIVSSVATNTFEIATAYIDDDAAGTWYESSELTLPDDFVYPTVLLALAKCLVRKTKADRRTPVQEAEKKLIQLWKSQNKQSNTSYGGRATARRWIR